MHRAFRTVILIFWSLCSQLIIGAQPSLQVVTNQSETHVNFDNLIIRRWKPQVRVTYDYYPFGLTWENPRLPGTEEGLHDHTYQDKEYQFAEFSDGRGLELHDFHARMYDATTGRWLVPDPAAQFANPYLAMGNNPVISVDPDGRVVVTAMIVGALIGASLGASLGALQATLQGQTGNQALMTIGVGALTGALSGLSGAFPLFGSGFGFLHGFGAGMVNGALSGALTGGISSALLGGNIEDGILNGAIVGGFIGGISGGISGIRKVNVANKRLEDGSYYRKSDGALIEKKPLTHQKNSAPVSQFDSPPPMGGKENCFPATLEWIDESFGGDLSQSHIRSKWFPGTNGNNDPIDIDDFLAKLRSETNYSAYLDSPSENGIKTMISSINKDGERVILILKTNNISQAHAVGVNQIYSVSILKQNGKKTIDTFFEVMNPWNVQHRFEVIHSNDAINAYYWMYIQN